MDMQDAVAVVTGAARGVGRAIAENDRLTLHIRAQPDFMWLTCSASVKTDACYGKPA